MLNENTQSIGTSQEKIWDMEIESITGIADPEYLPTIPTYEMSNSHASSPGSDLSSTPSGLMTPTIRSSHGEESSVITVEKQIYQRKRKMRKSWVFFPENRSEYTASDGKTRWCCAWCSLKGIAVTFSDSATKNIIEHLRQVYKIEKDGPIDLEHGQVLIESAFGKTHL
ncbi:hypothetical protein B9Z19DRAFT_1065152 [Tuber borchii]|uniref:Uncharacterized protein n=1 Tax=Tuber borchii TaxID=42251 RepID=A0A2T6ZS56_TUBBO|nr:hypothetical protein B9Z19DRAFT_1065152 [Tuber borchii]